MEVLSPTTPIVFFMEASDHLSDAAGKTIALSIAKPGAGWTDRSAAVTEVGGGLYKYTPALGDLPAFGPIILHASAAGCDPFDDVYFIGRDGFVVGDYTAIPVFLAQTIDHVTGATGITPVITASTAGGAYTTYTGSRAEVSGVGNGFGWYWITHAASDGLVAVAGSLAIHASGAGADITTVLYQVEAVVVLPSIVVGFTRTQLIGQVREVMDAANSARWLDSTISAVLGSIHRREWSGLLGANPYYRLATRSVTSAADGTLLYTALNSGSGDTTQTWSRILAITDGNVVYRQTTFAENPMATMYGGALLYDRLWYDAGSSIQILPVNAVALSVTVNWMPPRVDQLSADTSVVDFPDGHESVLWYEAAAMLLSKGGAENDAAQTMRAIAEQERQTMYSDIQRRSAKPIQFGYPDSSSAWGA